MNGSFRQLTVRHRQMNGWRQAAVPQSPDSAGNNQGAGFSRPGPISAIGPKHPSVWRARPFTGFWFAAGRFRAYFYGFGLVQRVD
jgi:hypothetical protein